MPELSKQIGNSFEEEFMQAAKDAGYYIQKMPERAGFDFILGIDDTLQIIETKCVSKNELRLRHFTPIEIRIAEAITERGLDYMIVFPLYGVFGEVTWKNIRTDLLSGKSVTLDNPFCKKAF